MIITIVTRQLEANHFINNSNDSELKTPFFCLYSLAFPDFKMFLHFSNLHLGHSSWFSSPTGNCVIFTFSDWSKLLHSHLTTISCETNSQVIPPLFFKYLQLPTATIAIMWIGFTLIAVNQKLFYSKCFQFIKLQMHWTLLSGNAAATSGLHHAYTVVIVSMLCCHLKNSRWFSRFIFSHNILKYRVSLGRR